MHEAGVVSAVARQRASRKPSKSEQAKVSPKVAARAAPLAPAREPRLDDPRYYLNRELSLLEFQQRVLDEARDGRNRLLERVKFLSIVCSNLDEFFMVRVAVLKQKLAAGSSDLSVDGRTTAEQLSAVHMRVERLMEGLYDCFRKQLSPALARHDIQIVDYSALNDRERGDVERYYTETIFPVLTPLAFDPGRPFPHISNLSLNLAIVLSGDDERTHFARIKVPQQWP